MSRRDRGRRYVPAPFLPTQLAGLTLWLQSSLGFTIVPSAVTAAGTTPPAVTLTGSIAAGQTQPSAATPYIEIDVNDVSGGTGLGQAKFQWKINGTIQQTGQVTAATFALGTTGLTANFPAGPYAANNVYTANINVSAWADQSGSGNNFTQATSANQPILQANGIDALQTPSFNGSAAFLKNAGSCGLGLTNWTVGLVSQASSVASNVALLGFNDAGTHGWDIFTGSTGRFANYGGVASLVDGVATTNPEVWVWTNTSSPSQLTSFYLNGVLTAITNSTQAPLADSTGTYLGSKTAAGASFFPGLISEVVGYGRALNAPDAVALSRYLGRRNGIATA